MTIKKLIEKLLAAQSVRYLISSCVAFAADYAVLLALNAVLSGAISFAISSQLNFWINRRWVFRSEKSPLPELGGYYSLALISFSVKTFVLLELEVRVLKIPLAIAKPLAEAVMFAVNYFVQKKIIFGRRRK